MINNDFGVLDLGGWIMFPLNKMQCVMGRGESYGGGQHRRKLFTGHEQ